MQQTHKEVPLTQRAKNLLLLVRTNPHRTGAILAFGAQAAMLGVGGAKAFHPKNYMLINTGSSFVATVRDATYASDLYIKGSTEAAKYAAFAALGSFTSMIGSAVPFAESLITAKPPEVRIWGFILPVVVGAMESANHFRAKARVLELEDKYDRGKETYEERTELKHALLVKHARLYKKSGYEETPETKAIVRRISHIESSMEEQ